MTARPILTPTAALTGAGLAFAALYAAGHDWAYVPSVACLAAPGVGGIAIALYEHVEDAAEEWTWQGIVRAFGRVPPRRSFWAGIVTHLPQALLALALLLRHPRRRP
ncbi:hypothetical protein HRbin24_00539 [bacterium HR24]|nr:hypothetical protein HRbin24_00539 [bacterium HR24]